MNSLQSLPSELFYDILGRITLKDIGNLSLTGSISLREKIMDWIKSASFQRTIAGRLRIDGNWRQITRDYGVMVKKVTILHESSCRLRLLSDWYERLQSLVSRDTLGRRNQLWRQYLSRAGLASALAELIKGWDVVEFHKILDWLRESENHLDGVNQRLLRTYFWEFLDSDLERAKWTSWLITTFFSLRLPITYIGTLPYNIPRFLMTVYGPAKIDVTGAEFLHLSDRQIQNVKKSLGKTDFSVLCNGDTSWENLQYQVEELARAVSSLRGNLPEHLIISVVDSFFESSIKGSLNQGEEAIQSKKKSPLLRINFDFFMKKENIFFKVFFFLHLMTQLVNKILIQLPSCYIPRRILSPTTWRICPSRLRVPQCGQRYWPN